MSLSPPNGTKLASSSPSTPSQLCYLGPARASHIRKEPEAGRFFIAAGEQRGRCSGNAGDVKRSQVSSETALISFLGSGDGDDSGFYTGSDTLKNQLELLEGSDCVWFSSK